MHILYFYQYFGTPRGSWSTRVYEMCRRWVDAGIEVTVVTAPYEKTDIEADGFISYREIDGIQIIVIDAGDSNRKPIWRRALNALFFAAIAIYYALRLPYNIVIASSGPITIGIPMVFAKIFRGKRSVFEVRDLWPAGGIEMGLITKGWQKKLGLWLEKVCYHKADLVITASPGQEEHILQRFPYMKTLVIPQGADLDLFGSSVQADLPDWTYEKFLFTHIGSLGLIHNCQLQLEAAKLLKARGWSDQINLIFIGDGAQRKKLEKFAETHELIHVHFLGLMPKEELPIWVQKSVATIFTTLNNPIQDTSSPNKIFDSFAAGTPIIQTTVGWIKDLIEENKAGINVPPDDPEALAEAMIKLVEHESIRKKLAFNARRLAETQFHRDHLSEKFLFALKMVMKGKSPLVVKSTNHFE